jgi:hypothetical protein
MDMESEPRSYDKYCQRPGTMRTFIAIPGPICSHGLRGTGIGIVPRYK